MLFLVSRKTKSKMAKLLSLRTGQYSALVDNTLLHLQNSSHPIQPHSIIATNSNNVRNEAKNET